MFTKRIPLATRFESHFVRGSADECWLWRGAPNSAGYGTIREPGRRGKTITAHRLAYVLAFGEVPAGLCVCHHCDVRLCVNPSHLFAGTNLDNVRDRDAKGRWQPPWVPGEACGHAKLTNESVYAIRQDSRTNTAIAKSYGVARSTISRVKWGWTWKHLAT